jgi:UBX domain
MTDFNNSVFMITCREEQERQLQMIEDRRNAIDQRREQKRTALAPEPEGGENCPPTTLIRVRLPHGGSSQRRFDEGAGVSAVYDWVDSLAEIDVWDYVITSTFPRREFSRSEGSIALSEAGLVPNAAIMVIAQDN